jgi:hypothetical protein
MFLPWIMLALALFSAICGLLFRMSIAIGLQFLALLVAGFVSYKDSSNTFQSFLMVVSFGAAFVFGSAALGVAAGTQLRNRRFGVATLMLAPFPMFLFYAHWTSTHEAQEKKLAYEFVTQNAQLAKLVGDPVAASQTSSDSNGRYDFSIGGARQLYAIVDAPRASGQSHFRLTCVTTLYLGRRESGKDACLQSTVPLPN